MLPGDVLSLVAPFPARRTPRLFSKTSAKPPKGSPKLTRPVTPRGLGRSGRRVWRDITTTYDLTPPELLTLERAARTADLLDRVDAELGPDVTAEGSMGQVRAHPLLRSRVELDVLLDQLLRSLALPFPDEAAGVRRSPAARATAAAQSWQHGKVGSDPPAQSWQHVRLGSDPPAGPGVA